MPVTIRFGGYQPPQSIHSRAAETFGDALAARCGTDVRFELDSDITRAGRKAADLLDMVEVGDLTLCYFSASYLAARVPEFALLDLPFTIRDRTHAYAVLDGKLGRLLSDRLAERTGYRLLGFWDNGFRHFSNARRPIRAPEDCRGLRIRTLFSDLHRQTFRQLGFEPVTLDVSELVPAVESGDIDAQENPLTNTYNFGIFRHHRYITLSGHFFGAAVLLCHRESFDGWPADLREAVCHSAREATEAQRNLAAKEDSNVLARLDPARNEVVTLTPEERSRFESVLAPLIGEQRQAFGETLFGMIAETPGTAGP